MIPSYQQTKVDTSKRRSKLKLCYEVLNCIKNGEKVKTRIMYQCGLNTQGINEVLELLSNKRHIRIDQTKTRHKIEITQTGVEILGSLEHAYMLMQI